MIRKSYAKVNLFLHILKKRADGYHNLFSLMHKINLFDYIEIKKNRGGIKLSSNVNDINDKNNLSYLSASEFFRISGIKPQVDITIEKHIPIGAGLGGGSSNAAYTLLMLNEMFDHVLSKSSLKKISDSLGSDISFFLLNKPAIAQGRGDILTSVNCDLNKYRLFLAVPSIKISTKYVYSRLLLTKRRPINRMTSVADFKSCDFGYIKKFFYNDLENVVLKEFTIVSDVKLLLMTRFPYTLMSGSGSSVFSIVSKDEGVYQKEIEDRLSTERVFFRTLDFVD